MSRAQTYSGFDVRNIPGCALWLDAADSNSFTFSSGSNISAWNDKSGNGYNASASNSPTRVSNTVVFNGTNNYFTIPDATPLRLLSDFGIYVVINAPNAVLNTTQFLLSKFIDTGVYNGWDFRAVTPFTTVNADWFNGGDNGTPYSADITTVPICDSTTKLVNLVQTGTSLVSYINGSSNKSVSAGPPTTSTATMAIGVRGSGSLSGYYKGDIREIIIYNTTLTASQRQQVEGYLAWKWGLQFSNTTVGTVPASISGLRLWLDAADASSITLSGSSVTQWRDKSGSNNHTSNSGTGVTTGTTLNGMSTLAFANGSYLITSNAAIPVDTLNQTFFAVCKFTSNAYATDANYYGPSLLKQTTVQTGSFNFCITRNNASPYVWRFENSLVNYGPAPAGSTITTNAAGPTNAVFIMTMQRSGTGTGLVRYSGSNMTTSFATSQGSSASDSLTVGSSMNGTQIGELLLYSGALTTTQIQQIETYLSGKWNVPLTGSSIVLPTTHPFYRNPVYVRPFLPLDIPGLAFWIDAADTTTFTYGTGSNIATWKDKVNGVTLTPVGTNANLTLVSNAIGSNTAAFFDNGASEAVYMSGTFNNIQTGSAFMVFKALPQRTIYWRPFFCFQNGVGSTPAYGYLGSTANNLTVGPYTAGKGPNGTPTQSLTSNSNYMIYYDWNGSTTTNVGTNGSSLTAGSQPTYTSNATSLWIGADGGPTCVNGYIGEIMLFSSNLTSNQRQAIEGYLAWKWGFRNAGTLPTTHPFYKVLSSTPQFYPNQIPGCALWLDAADSSTLAFSSGSNVATWRDKVSNITMTSQGTSSNLTTVSNGIGTNTCLYFNNSASDSVYMSGTFSNITAGSAFYVFKALPQRTIDYRPFAAWYSGGQYPVYGYMGGTTNLTVGPYTTFGSGNGTPSQALTSNSNYIIYYGWSGTSTNVATNGTLVTGSQSAYASSTSTFWIGADGAGASARTNWYVGEILMFTSNLTSNQRQTVEGYLAQKWGLRSTLPTTHPYAKFSP